MVDQLVREIPDPKTIQYVLKEEYETFCKEFIFDRLRDTPFGLAFCQRFKIIDVVLLMDRGEVATRQYIKDAGYIK